MNYTEKRGNLFELADEYVLAHCISLDCKMGAGIATEFNLRYRGMKEMLVSKISNYNLSVPCTIPAFSKGQLKVINLITKNKYYDKPTYDNITKTIIQMKEICIRQNVKKLAIPKIGCGLDKLKWTRVKSIILDVFKDTDIEIAVRYL